MMGQSGDEVAGAESWKEGVKGTEKGNDCVVIGSVGRQSHSSLLQLKIAKWVCRIGWHLADAREYLLTSVASAVSITSAVLCYDMLFRVSHSHLLFYNECKKQSKSHRV